MLAPVGASKGFEDAESIAGFCGYVVNVGGEGELGVKGDTQNSGGPVERKWEGVAGEGNVGVVVMLGGVRGEKGDGRLRGRQEQTPLPHPVNYVSGVGGENLCRVLGLLGRGGRREVVRIGGEEGGCVGVS